MEALGLLLYGFKVLMTWKILALMMVGLKLQRQAMKHKRDNLVDAHGYLLVYAHIRGDSGSCGSSGSSSPSS